MADTKEINESTKVGSAELALTLGITARYIRQLREDGVLKAEGRGSYPLIENVQAYIAFLKRGSIDDADVEAAEKERTIADAKLKAAKADVAEMEAEELKGKMHRAEDVEALTNNMIYAMRSALVSLPGRLAVDVAAAQTAAQASAIIKREVHAIMRELADYEYDPSKYEELVRERREWENDNNETE